MSSSGTPAHCRGTLTTRCGTSSASRPSPSSPERPRRSSRRCRCARSPSASRPESGRGPAGCTGSRRPRTRAIPGRPSWTWRSARRREDTMAARTDSVPDQQLAGALLLARRGQAYFSRKLNELRDDEFDAPSLLPGWTRRHLVAHVGYNARANARLVEWAATGVETPMYYSPTQREDEIEFGATLPIEALRNLSAHAAVHLNVEWRDLTEEAWSHEVRTAQGRLVPVRETVWMRTREVWIHAVDLDN